MPHQSKIDRFADSAIIKDKRELRAFAHAFLPPWFKVAIYIVVSVAVIVSAAAFFFPVELLQWIGISDADRISEMRASVQLRGLAIVLLSSAVLFAFATNRCMMKLLLVALGFVSVFLLNDLVNSIVHGNFYAEFAMKAFMVRIAMMSLLICCALVYRAKAYDAVLRYR
jgi:hypothetical protein